MQRWECWLSLRKVEGSLPACSRDVNLLSTTSRVLFTHPIILNASLPVPSVLSIDRHSRFFFTQKLFWTEHLHQFHLVPVSATQPLDKIAWPEDISSFQYGCPYVSGRPRKAALAGSCVAFASPDTGMLLWGLAADHPSQFGARRSEDACTD